MVQARRLAVAIVIFAILAASFNAQASGMADSPWPCFGGNAQHTGLSKYDASDNPGVIRWHKNIGGYGFSSIVIGKNDTLYFASSGNGVLAFDRDGNRLWSCDTSCSYSTPAIAQDGTLFVGDSSNNFYAIDGDGSTKWTKSFGGWCCSIHSSPVIDKNGFVYITSDNRNFYSMKTDGTIRWQIDVYDSDGFGSGSLSSPAADNAGILYIGSTDSNLYAIKPDGAIKWKFATGGAIYDASPVIDKYGTIYIGCEDGCLYSINSDGTLKWKYKTNGELGSSTPAIMSDGAICIISYDNRIYKINRNGDLEWSFSLGTFDKDTGMANPVVSSDGTIFIGWGEKLSAVNPNGTLKWTIQLEYDIRSSPAIGSDGTLYVVTSYGHLYSIGCGPSTPPLNFDVLASPGKNVLEWDAPANDGGSEVWRYHVFRTCSVTSSIGGLMPCDWEYVGASYSTTKEDSEIEAGQTYYYCVVAENSEGFSEDSNWDSVQAIAADAIPFPSAVFTALALLLPTASRKRKT
ncbi:MAG: PQQ-binding-like beta-propeller repeat protein [Candidatus Thermoplasmatota archaeon]|nr:PQQ-binding-like beta-propeller repeat protein [Candidatus Thermoplasmatota archaeon]